MSAEDIVHRERVKEQFDFPNWGGKIKSDKRGLCRNFLLPFEELNGLTLEEREDLTQYHKVRQVFRYIYSNKDAPHDDRVIIQTFECTSVIEAHESLIDILMSFTAPTLPRCESLGMNIGDVCFGTYSERQHSMIFTRYNVIVDITSAGFHDVIVNEIAEKIDALILKLAS
jgi:hypothetical protein